VDNIQHNLKIKELEKGSIFGALSLLRDNKSYKRPYQAKCLTNCHVAHLMKKSYERILDRIYKKLV
jgi:hypothetical protein